MKETTKHSRAHKRGSVKVDRISSLPDELLIRVLSFLTTKEAVQTCILSKRWRRVWVNLPILNFNIDEFGIDDSTGAGDEALRKSITRFQHFVNGVVENLESTNIDRVYYVHDTKPPYFYIGEPPYFNNVPMHWLDRVALLMPQLIDITIAGVESVEFPDSLFSCATLQHLKIKLLKVKKIPLIPASIHLPSLKVFDVTHVELHESFPQNLLMGCPSLVTLKIRVRKLHFFRIFSNTLRELFIAGSDQYEPIQVSCPNLVSLRIGFYLRGGANISLTNMKFLKIASIALGSVGRHFGGGDEPVLNILDSLSGATKLSIHIARPELKVPLERDILNCRNFYNLKELLIGMCGMSFDFNLVASLLKLSPNVEKLTLVLDVRRISIDEEHRQEVLGDVLFQHKYIEIVSMCDWHKRELPEALMRTFIKTLNAYVKEIGSVIIE